MRTVLTGSVLAALAIAALGSGGAFARTDPPAAPARAPAAPEPSADRGHALVLRHCAGCHAVETTGDSAFSEAPPFRTLKDRYPVEDLEEALAEGIMSGHPAMPQFQFSAEDAADIVAWLKGLEGA